MAFDIAAGQRLYIDTINPNPSPSATVLLVSPSGVQTTLATQNDFDSVANLFGALSFAEAGKYYILVVGEQNTAFQFQFQVLDFDTAPLITPGQIVSETFESAGRSVIYRVNASAGQTLYYDSLSDNRLTNLTVYGPGGQQIDNFTQSDQRPITFPETSTYFFVFSSATFGQPVYAFDCSI